MTLYRSNVKAESITDESESGPVSRVVFRYDEIRFADGEFDLVRQGMLPAGVSSWTDDLRRIERSALYDDADVCIARATDHISQGKNVQAWTDYISEVRAYKMHIRSTVESPEYPKKVTYPQMPRTPY